MSRRPYIRPVAPTTWYLQHKRYRVYMLREATCLLVVVYCVLILAGLAALASDQAEPWNRFLASQGNFAWMAFHAFALVYFIVYQTMAWFQLAPKAMPLQMGETRVPAKVIVAAHYVIWVIASAMVFFMAGVF